MARGSQNAFGILQARPGPRLRAGLESGFIDQPGTGTQSSFHSARAGGNESH